MKNQNNETMEKVPDRIERTYHDKNKKILKEEIPYKNNRIDGMRKEYREDGTTYECVYKNGEKHGAEREYSDDGRLVSETFYVNGSADGPFAVLSFFLTDIGAPPFTILKTIGRYVRGKYDGLIEHYTDGMISETEIYCGGERLRTTQWRDGIRHGKDICYDTSGNHVRVASYNKGGMGKEKKVTLGPEYDYDSYSGNDAYKKTLPLEGCRPASYYSFDDSIGGTDGARDEVRTMYEIKDGAAEGMWKHFYEENLLEAAVPYKCGRAHGTARSYYYSGALFSETPYVNGEKDGPEKYYEDRPNSPRIFNSLIPPGKPAKVLYFRGGIQAGAPGMETAFGRA
jgi:antitoxin component YwqK of YwqJK toxin-antitoxin module